MKKPRPVHEPLHLEPYKQTVSHDLLRVLDKGLATRESLVVVYGEEAVVAAVALLERTNRMLA